MKATKCHNQCCGSGSMCLLGLLDPISSLFVWIRILSLSSKKFKNLDFSCFATFFMTFYPLKTDVCKCTIKINKQNTKATNEKSRSRSHKSVVRIRGPGSVHKCHGSSTLVSKILRSNGPPRRAITLKLNVRHSYQEDFS